MTGDGYVWKKAGNWARARIWDPWMLSTAVRGLALNSVSSCRSALWPSACCRAKRPESVMRSVVGEQKKNDRKEKKKFHPSFTFKKSEFLKISWFSRPEGRMMIVSIDFENQSSKVKGSFDDSCATILGVHTIQFRPYTTLYKRTAPFWIQLCLTWE